MATGYFPGREDTKFTGPAPFTLSVSFSSEMESLASEARVHDFGLERKAIPKFSI